MRNIWAGTFRLLGAALALVSCIPMLAMLPAGFATALSLIGLATPPIVAWAAPLAPVAPLLFILSLGLLIAGHSRCGWQPASVAAVGGLLVYLAMYVFVIPVAMDAMTGMEQMTSPDTSQAAMSGMTGLTNAPLFYAGLILLVGSFGLVVWRRRANVCRPFNPFGFLRTTRQN
jgi:LPXTG-motif cell wall-anchored protein